MDAMHDCTTVWLPARRSHNGRAAWPDDDGGTSVLIRCASYFSREPQTHLV
jgi:hypothetical protein